MNVMTSPERVSSFTVEPLSPAIGAEIANIDLSEELSDATIAGLREALLKHKVIFFRDQSITRAQHIAFARRFGELRAVTLRDPAVWQVYLAAPPVERMTPAAARLAETLLDAAASAG